MPIKKENEVMVLIDKAAIIAEIEKLRKVYKQIPTHSNYEDGLKEGRLIGYKDALNKINKLEVKEVAQNTTLPQLTWQGIRLISEIGEDFLNSENSDNLTEEEYYTVILNKFNENKIKTSRQEIRDLSK